MSRVLTSPGSGDGAGNTSSRRDERSAQSARATRRCGQGLGSGRSHGEPAPVGRARCARREWTCGRVRWFQAKGYKGTSPDPAPRFYGRAELWVWSSLCAMKSVPGSARLGPDQMHLVPLGRDQRAWDKCPSGRGAICTFRVDGPLGRTVRVSGRRTRVSAHRQASSRTGPRKGGEPGAFFRSPPGRAVFLRWPSASKAFGRTPPVDDPVKRSLSDARRRYSRRCRCSCRPDRWLCTSAHR
jgi:hypothetical protein